MKGARLEGGRVVTPSGWKTAYQQYARGGWIGAATDADIGGMGLPHIVGAALQEMLQSANMSFAVCPMLSQGAIKTLSMVGTATQKETFLPRMVSGEWTGTMALTEPQAGSDLGAVRTKAERRGDRYLISGQKIFITYGDHDLTDNIIHLVLARSSAGAGTKGLSLFVVPKFLVGEDGSLGSRQRRALRFHRTQARHSRQPDRVLVIRRQWSLRRRSCGRGRSRPRIHVHHDE